jgi:hypothetical protein
MKSRKTVIHVVLDLGNVEVIHLETSRFVATEVMTGNILFSFRPASICTFRFL